ncbi:MAG: hydroxymethylbilane synthase [Microbacterium sp. SCN 70-200]|uniref:hydroxymethylbilane synthase n=1 Tax=unclassified Microbacterium TaxID=2609290 RepID=UPI0008697347|nr:MULTISPECIES: hydroxymethylbilane synthase [unclassified Microbacterium]MBN9213416.1 hydroxymethylbilane synthase [Microbacterium sp.]ODT40579.1 MAG: hydroxymethylbilane synthase [Microbacterium sp. SCN 70-200]OJV85193.1 MAG: hydroxymethylbilane synthase [Microbacterium sp. 70-16]
MTAAPTRLGTRASLLATTQSGLVADAVRAATGREVELVPITTAGDVLTGPLAQLGGTGVFVAALREALLRGECDLVVHSMKDLPTGAVEGLKIGAVPPRAPIGDVLCSRDGQTLAQMPHGAVVGSGSPRRVAQLLRARPDLDVRGIRGNVDTRLRKVDDGEYDAIVLAAAGLTRIGRVDRIVETFDSEAWPTSAGQGALAVEVRTDDPFADELAVLSDADAEITALLERAVLRGLEAGCAAPVGITARVSGDVVALLAEVYALDGTDAVRVEQTFARGTVADDTGRQDAAAQVVTALLDGGAASLADLAGSSR